jgi:glycosyltransferase involved in cell wall biosynthesis
LRRSPHPEEALLQQRPWDDVPVPPPLLPAVASAVDASAEPHLAAATRITPPTTPRGMRRIVFVSGEPNTPGHSYRIVRAAEAASRLGLIVSWMRIEEAEARGQEISAADVVYIWRAANSPVVTNLLGRARAAGAKVVFDVDDLVFEPKLAEISIIDGIRTLQLTETEVAGLFNLFSQVVTQVDACVATTEALAERLRACNRVTFVLPNGFDDAVLEASRRAVRRRHGATDGLIRLGYAAGTRTHQADFRVAVDAIATLLRERPQCRLVLFRDPAAHTPVLMVDEFSVLAGLEDQIEWRDMVPLGELANEMARFDINLVPLEAGNPFCESKSELKYFESALVEVCTVASATGPMRAAIRDGETGRIADTPASWHQVLRELVDDPQQRARLARAAYFDVLWRFGPQRRAATLGAILAQLDGDERGAAAFELELRRHKQSAVPRHIDIPPAETVFQSDRDGVAEVTVVVPLYNYAHYIEEALESVRLQSLSPLDLVVVDDASTDDSLAVALAWIRRHASRFNRIVVLRNHTNAGLARTRNVGFAMAETPFVLPLDADNKLRPDCGARCLAAMHTSQAAFVYPSLQCFGSVDFAIGEAPFTANRLIGGNYIDAMALIAKWAWAAVGGYVHIDNGWEDYDFWCNCVEHGLWGLHVPEILADYRVHPKSMLRTRTDDLTNKFRLIADMERRHTWLHILEV